MPSSADRFFWPAAVTVTPNPLPHHELLANAMRGSTRWRKCGEAGEVMAYCRAAPPLFPFKPARIDLRQHIGAVIEESPLKP